MRKPIDGDVWRHKEGTILVHMYKYNHDVFNKYCDQVEKLFNIKRNDSWRRQYTQINEYNDLGQHRHGNTWGDKWDLVEFIGNIHDPTRLPEDDWSD